MSNFLLEAGRQTLMLELQEASRLLVKAAAFNNSSGPSREKRSDTGRV